MGTLASASLLLMIVAVLLTGVRLVRGPSDFDRLLAAETVSLGLVGLMMLLVNQADGRFYVDAALGMALFSFAGTVVLAKYLAHGGEDD